jgi:threonine/homoserine/homoserine lactone efflux protein
MERRPPSSFGFTTQQAERWLNRAVGVLMVILGMLLAWWML